MSMGILLGLVVQGASIGFVLDETFAVQALKPATPPAAQAARYGVDPVFAPRVGLALGFRIEDLWTEWGVSGGGFGGIATPVGSEKLSGYLIEGNWWLGFDVAQYGPATIALVAGLAYGKYAFSSDGVSLAYGRALGAPTTGNELELSAPYWLAISAISLRLTDENAKSGLGARLMLGARWSIESSPLRANGVELAGAPEATAAGPFLSLSLAFDRGKPARKPPPDRVLSAR